MASILARPGVWIGVAAITTVPLIGSVAMNPHAFAGRLTALLGYRQPGGWWRLIAILLALGNLKSLPFAWHIRLVRALLKHVSLLRSRCPPAPPLPSLFAPLITRTRCSLLEMDYNLHKSNSTYFTDLDISRMHLVSCLMKRGLHKLHFKTAAPLLSDQKPGRFGIYFGGVQCSFRREVKPGQRVEIWTRILSWDRKWLYLVSHIVEEGAAAPKGYWLQPWRKSSKKASDTTDKAPRKAILATSVSKYVFKQGRITIPPELALQGAELLPPKPTSFPDPSPQPSGTATPAPGETDNLAVPAAAAANLASILPGNSSSSPGSAEDLGLSAPLDVALENWDWDAVERERLRGLRLARHLTDLDDAVMVWSGGQGMALGEY